ncbi:MAG: hypothetical protein A2V52_07400 [Actinobacteria bacterium RBG_19FT_COMBO_54_7]|uniref:Dihydroorotase n=1 Tax=Candidatus Solincola sediminis TaxID=1797199 RepID=A0A1F2WSG7_9ACTN|nr:MAG: hypothetical protein A2Y75_04830 [Candidatus Solincola sediminis]OFW70604.1 MAG: hypothetical protein A2V52_07400 [Actinobacteria bacterium RBG_19FT_COMBO_54_7]
MLIKGAGIVDPFNRLYETRDVLISRGRVAEVGKAIKAGGRQVIEAGGRILAPGFLDLHAHLREPGREDAETLESGLNAALRGGYTAVCCMPNTNPPLDNAPLIEGIYNRAQALGLADLFPIGCLSARRKGRELAEMALMHMSRAAVSAFSDDGDGIQDAGLMRRALEYASGFGGIIISHEEDSVLSNGGQINEGAMSNELGLRGMPAAAEEVMVARDLLLCALTGCRLHIAHVSTAGSVGMIREAKSRGVPVTAEATPHHLLLSENDMVPYDTVFKVNPPLRTPEDVRGLREGLLDGTIDAIATDHAPHTIEDKEREFDNAPFGVIGLESAFTVLYTELVKPGDLSLERLIELLTLGPSTVMNLNPPFYGGGLCEGSRADLVLLDMDEEYSIDAFSFASKGRNCPFHGRRVFGRVVCTLKNGKIAYMVNVSGKGRLM